VVEGELKNVTNSTYNPIIVVSELSDANQFKVSNCKTSVATCVFSNFTFI